MGATTAAIVGGSAALFGAREQRKAAKDQRRAAEAGISEQRLAREALERRLQPYVDLGVEQAERMSNFLADPSAGIDDSAITPLIDFLRRESFEDIQESAAARGALSAGGTLRDLQARGEELAAVTAPSIAAQQRQQRFNELFSVLGAGQNAAAGVGQAGFTAAGNIGQLQQQAAGASMLKADATTNALQNIMGAIGQFPTGGAPAAGPAMNIAPMPAVPTGDLGFGNFGFGNTLQNPIPQSTF